MAAPKALIAPGSEYPASIKRMGSMIDTNDIATELAERIAVIGRAERIRGINSDLGLENLFFRIKNTKIESANEKTYEIRTATPAL